MVSVKNPILRGFYPDPSICRVGKDFYLVNSSFVYFPGVPIFHSRDLAHWEQIGNILDREEQCPFEGSEISKGIFAPTIRYHNGLFYMITTNVSFGGNFIVTAEKPEGPWSDPYYLGAEAQGIDPSLFFDDDGKCYYVGTRPNPEGVRYNGDWEIWIQELDIANMKLVGKSMAIWKGAVKDVIWPEGPHIYKINGYYYLLHAEGGTGPEHAISIARSKELFKWFEGSPRNPIFSHRNLGVDYPVIYVGHGDFVEDGEGNWYIVMLASRPCKKHSSMGRETFLAKVTWENEWPVINPGIGKLEDKVTLPFEERRFGNEFSNHDHFNFWGDKLDDRLLGIIKRSEDIYSLSAKEGFLRLFTRKEVISNKENASYLGIRQKNYKFDVKTGMCFTPQTENETAGLVLYQNHSNNLRMEVLKSGDKNMFRITEHIKDIDNFIAESEISIKENSIIEIFLRASDQNAEIWIKEKDEMILIKNNISLLPYTTEQAGGFVGCTIGMYTSSNGTNSTNYADFSWFSYDGND
ncbi:glycoside hydrolase family 43 protein [Thiospirochaeta perfilievii]|uniref:Glycoside hydrolase family 43 protein n=1 Tax=Thiospirochaeta perfilievii TaxID=252967 RepID=A0A5C1Q7Y7_9SPIO|nr:glycoside hydrolase family 43 protein [Thiospirochaeta perfilievii]QEN03438.1 glycoside hydrolase family 43 protein [Thiospirochaeta perfilievii]